MALQYLMIIMTTLLTANVIAERQQTISLQKTKFQQCNSTSCECTTRNSDQAFIQCNQACYNTICKSLKCSSGSCHQECHNCQMTCTSDTDLCKQRCLSGTCSFECAAKHCVRQCNDEKCESTREEEHKEYQLGFPKYYLIILAVLFGLMAVLSLGLLVYYTWGCNQCEKQHRYHKLQSFSDSFESIDSVSILA
ncbi:PREDICTED: uncharacterized protein LOC107358360 [Acropora digitifera]|uniref:uncharacterized protein LOC107358360 n=1 Tax=Acropora digitifera TaxID=70779 RepID=UPI00077A3662|nr:PREDICTED: uncharacterized protein LOC107358360 [Acropora digitifera]